MGRRNWSLVREFMTDAPFDLRCTLEGGLGGDRVGPATLASGGILRVRLRGKPWKRNEWERPLAPLAPAAAPGHALGPVYLLPALRLLASPKKSSQNRAHYGGPRPRRYGAFEFRIRGATAGHGRSDQESGHTTDEEAKGGSTNGMPLRALACLEEADRRPRVGQCRRSCVGARGPGAGVPPNEERIYCPVIDPAHGAFLRYVGSRDSNPGARGERARVSGPSLFRLLSSGLSCEEQGEDGPTSRWPSAPERHQLSPTATEPRVTPSARPSPDTPRVPPRARPSPPSARPSRARRRTGSRSCRDRASRRTRRRERP